MGADRWPVVPCGRPISLRIHPALLARLDREVDRLNRARPPRPVTRTSLIQRAVRAFLDGPAERIGAAVEGAPVPGVAEAHRHWRADGAPVAGERRTREDRRHGLWRRFEQACDQDQVTPPEWLRLAVRHDSDLDRAVLLAWYRVGELPEGEHGDRLMDLVERWLESS